MLKFVRVRAGRPAGALWLPVLFCALCALLWTLAPAQAQAAKDVEHPADAPVRRFQTLLTKKNVSKEALRKLEAELEQARSARPDSAGAAKAGFFLARVQQEIAKRSGQRADWFKAAESFGACAERFPKYQLAPDALIHRGTIRLERLADPEGAAADFAAVQRNYPRSPLAARAAQMQRQVPRPGAPSVKRVEPAPEPPPPPMPDRPQLLEVRARNTGPSARVVIELDGRVKYRYQLLAGKAGGKGARIYVDLLGARPRPGLPEDAAVTGGLLKRWRAAPKDRDATRVTLEFDALKDYRVTQLESPFRLVVDAFGTQEAKAATPPPRASQPEDDDPALAAFAAPTGSRKKLAANLVEQLGLSVRTIMLDAGHGGKDPGARGFGLVEKDVNLRMVLILGKMLKERGFRVVYTRTTDDFLALEERTALANAKKADLFLSVHCNAHTDPSLSGLETYSLNLAKTPDAVRVAARENSVSDKNISDLQMILTDLMLTSKIKESVDLARVVHRHGLATLRDKWTVGDHGNREAPFYVLMGAKMPAVLVEIGYVTNRTEAGRLKTDAYLRVLAGGIADGVMGYKQQIERYAGK